MYVVMILIFFYVGLRLPPCRRLTHLKGRRPGGLRGTESPCARKLKWFAMVWWNAARAKTKNKQRQWQQHQHQL
jgi:hypothetical protein